MIPLPTSDGRIGFVPHSGGAALNSAIALGRLGIPTGIIAGMSTDQFGQHLTSTLHASHVDTTRAMMSDRPTTLAFVHLTDGHATYTFFDENSAGRMVVPADLPALPQDSEAVLVGGISLACEPGADTFLALTQREAGARVIMLDPNIRPGFIQDIDRYRSRLSQMIALSDIVKVSDEDLNWIYPGAHSLSEKLVQVRAQGPSVVILTRGSRGAQAFLKNGQDVTVPANTVQVVDTVGAGDTFNAGVLAKLSELGCLTKTALDTLSPEILRQTLEFGARAAAITVSRAGANPPWRKELS